MVMHACSFSLSSLQITHLSQIFQRFEFFTRYIGNREDQRFLTTYSTYFWHSINPKVPVQAPCSITNPPGVAAILPRQVRRVHLQIAKCSILRFLVYNYPPKQSIGLPRSVHKNSPWEPVMVTLVSFFKMCHFRLLPHNSWSGVRTCYPNIDVY